MRIHGVRQGSREWYDLRLGRPTASNFSRILTPKTRKYSAAARTYIAELVAERLLGMPIAWGAEDDTIWTGRGTALEADARRWYEFTRGVTVEQVGFVTALNGKVGGSPDGLVGDDGIVEIKCYGARHHVETLLDVTPMADDTQVQGYLWLTGRQWADVVCYNPSMPSKLERVPRDPEWMDALGEAIHRFLRELDRAQAITDAMDGRDMIDGGGLHLALTVSLLRAADLPDDTDPSEVLAAIRGAHDAGTLDDDDVGAIVDDARSGNWPDVLRMADYAARAGR